MALRYRDRGHQGLGSANGADGSVVYANQGALAYINSTLDRYRALVLT